jgi:hypothetical protein
MAKTAVVPTPPRATGDPQVDAMAMIQWAWDFYRSTVIESGLLDPAFQANAGQFNPNALPDPANTTIAKAQDTANHAIRALQGANIPIPP